MFPVEFEAFRVEVEGAVSGANTAERKAAVTTETMARRAPWAKSPIDAQSQIGTCLR